MVDGKTVLQKCWYNKYMENYKKVSSETVIDVKREPWNINVKSGTKLRNLIGHAMKLLKTDKQEKIVLTGSGPTVTKTISCAEIVKRKVKGLHQHNKLFYTSVEDQWEPKREGLDLLKVTRKVPSITITLSTKPLDPKDVGYQAPGKYKSPVEFNSNDFELSEDHHSSRKCKDTQSCTTNKKRHRSDTKKGKMQAAGENGTKKHNVEQEEDGEPQRSQDKKETNQRHNRKRGGYHDGPKTKAAKKAAQDSQS